MERCLSFPALLTTTVEFAFFPSFVTTLSKVVGLSPYSAAAPVRT